MRRSRRQFPKQSRCVGGGRPYLCRRPRDSQRASVHQKGRRPVRIVDQRVQNFMPLALSAAEKSVTVQKQQNDKQAKLRTID